jgi:thiaminase/transcriptional activator TenA
MNHIQPTGYFTSDLWQAIEGIFRRILDCDFVVRLSGGTLSRVSFAHYLSQDILYLQQDNEALEILANRSFDGKYGEFFSQLAQDGIEIEKMMHDEYLDYFQIEEAGEQSTAFSAYGSFILRHAFLSPYPVAAAALLPCFWVYAETGMEIVNNSVKNNKYRKFIGTYSGDKYINYVEKYICIVEELGQEASPELQKRMKDAFIKATEFELAVFEESTDLS